MERNNKNILTIVMIALTLIVAVVLIAVFASRGAASDQTGETTTTTSKPEEEGPKFTVPKDGDGNPLLKTFNDAKDYCKTEYKGKLAESSSLDDWRDPESVKRDRRGFRRPLQNRTVHFQRHGKNRVRLSSCRKIIGLQQ